QLLLVYLFFVSLHAAPRDLPSFPTRRSSDLGFRPLEAVRAELLERLGETDAAATAFDRAAALPGNDVEAAMLRERSAALRTSARSEEHTSELQSRENLVCRLLLEKKNTNSAV